MVVKHINIMFSDSASAKLENRSSWRKTFQGKEKNMASTPEFEPRQH